MPLDATGREEAQKLAQRVAHEPITLVITSDLRRTVETGRAIARHQQVGLIPTRALRPWGVGVLQGRPATEGQPYLEHYAREAPEQPIPEGESFNQFKRRLLPAMRRLLATLAETGKTVALVSHFRDLKLIEAWLKAGGEEDIHLPTFFKNDLSPAAIVELVRQDGKWCYRVLSKGGE